MDAQGFRNVPQRRGRGRGRGRGAPRPDFSTYQLREAQKARVTEFLQRSAEEWFEALAAAPALVCANMARDAIYAAWWGGLVQHRLEQGLEVDAGRSALMFRSAEHAVALFNTCPWLQFVSHVADPWAIEAASPVAVPEGSVLPDSAVTDAAVAAVRDALRDKAHAFVTEYEAAHPAPRVEANGTWWKEMEEEEESAKKMLVE